MENRMSFCRWYGSTNQVGLMYSSFIQRGLDLGLEPEAENYKRPVARVVKVLKLENGTRPTKAPVLEIT